ncbi:uncharacterized protein J3R85_006112 [Psidium guajava]|nr:uncharacterized protein J3R85_006112 [Psidium guajava]
MRPLLRRRSPPPSVAFASHHTMTKTKQYSHRRPLHKDHHLQLFGVVVPNRSFSMIALLSTFHTPSLPFLHLSLSSLQSISCFSHHYSPPLVTSSRARDLYCGLEKHNGGQMPE